MKFSRVTILQGVELSIFLLIFEWALQQCSATALPVIGKRVLRVISSDVSKLKNFSKSQVIACTLKVVGLLSRKQETLLLQPSNRSGYVTSNRAISDDLQ